MAPILVGILFILIGCIPRSFYIDTAGWGYRNPEAHIPSDGMIFASRTAAIAIGAFSLIFGIVFYFAPESEPQSSTWGSVAPEMYDSLTIGSPVNGDLNECEFGAIAYGIAGALDDKNPDIQLEADFDGSLIVAFDKGEGKVDRISVVESPDRVEIQVVGTWFHGSTILTTGCLGHSGSFSPDSADAVAIIPLEKPLGTRTVSVLSNGNELPLIKSLPEKY